MDDLVHRAFGCFTFWSWARIVTLDKEVIMLYRAKYFLVAPVGTDNCEVVICYAYGNNVVEDAVQSRVGVHMLFQVKSKKKTESGKKNQCTDIGDKHTNEG